MNRKYRILLSFIFLFLAFTILFGRMSYRIHDEDNYLRSSLNSFLENYEIFVTENDLDAFDREREIWLDLYERKDNAKYIETRPDYVNAYHLILYNMEKLKNNSSETLEKGLNHENYLALKEIKKSDISYRVIFRISLGLTIALSSAYIIELCIKHKKKNSYA